MAKPNKPSIDTSRINALLEQKQEIPAFPPPEKVEIKSHTVVCFAPARAEFSGEQKQLLLRLNSRVYELLKQHSSGSTSVCIEKLVEYAIEDLLKRNISIK